MDQNFLNSQRQKLRAATAITGPSGYGYLEGLGKSALASIPEMVGIGAPPAVEDWRQENPWSGLASQVLPTLVPYAGWAGVAGKLPGIGRAIRALSTAERIAASPVRTAVAREMVRFAPFEAARIGASAAIGDPGSVGDIATEAAINLGAGSVLVGLGALWKASRVTGEAKLNADLLQKIYPDFNPAAPRQMQLRQLYQAAAAREASLGSRADTDGILAQLRAQLARMELEIRQEIAPEGAGGLKGRYLDGLEGDADSQVINRMFYPHAGKNATRMRFTASSRLYDFDNVQEWQEVALRFGLPKEWLSYVQFPRYTKYKTGNAATSDLALVKKNLSAIGDGWYIGREPEGLYVMARRLKGDKARNDEWLWFKTDTPSMFATRQTKWADLMVDRSRWEAGRIPAKDLQMAKDLNVYGALENMLESLPYENAKAIPQGSLQKTAQVLFEKLGGSGDVSKTTSTTYNRLMRMAREYVAPTQFQFSKSPLARYILGAARYTYDHAQATAERLMYGVQPTSAGSIFREIWGAPKEVGSIKAALDAVPKEELVGVWRTWARQLSPDAARKELGLSDAAYRFLKKLEDVDRWQVDQIINTQRVTGNTDFRPLLNHLMISRTWEGSWRLPLYDEGGNMVAMAAGKTANAADLAAKKLVERGKALGKRLIRKDEFPVLADRRNDFQLAGRLKVNSPTFRLLQSDRTRVPNVSSPRTFRERTGVGGYLGEDAPWTKAELEELIRDHIYTYQKYLAEASVNHRMTADLLKLAQQDAHTYRQLTDRLRDLSGKPGPLSRFQNDLVDRVMAPVLGKNSASKIVGTLNTVTHNLQLGFGNLAFPVLNAMTFLQTVLPHTAFVLGGTPEKVARYYTWFPAEGTKGVRAGIGALDMFKLMGQSIKEMKRPDAELMKNFQRAGAEGVWDPRFVEEYIGQGARAALGLKRVLQGEQGIVGWLKALSEFLPGQSEKLARGHAMTLGHIVGRDMLGLKDEKLYHFAREFVHNTMYLYSTADRARLITGPVGSLFGMFKNWQMHFLAQMMIYTDEAVMRNNWKPLLWMAGGTGAMAGAGGMPLYAAADLMSRWMTDESLMLNIYQMFGGEGEEGTRLADSVYYGLPGMLGISLQGSAAAPGADPARDASMLFTFAQLDRMRYIGKAMGAVIDNWAATGEHPGQDANVRDLLVRALGPKTIYRLSQVLSDGALRSLSTGYPVMNNLDIRERALFALGLTPTDIDRTYAVADELWRDQEKMRIAVQRYGAAWAEAQAEGDSEVLSKIVRNAVAEGVDISSIIRSAQARRTKQREPQLQRQFEVRKIAPFVEAGMVQ